MADESSTELVQNVAVPRWAMNLLVWFLIVLSGGAVSSISILINHQFRTSERLANAESKIATHTDELLDHSNAFNELKRGQATTNERLAGISETLAAILRGAK